LRFACGHVHDIKICVWLYVGFNVRMDSSGFLVFGTSYPTSNER